jgi:urease accessory protein
MDRDSRKMRGARPFIFTNLKKDLGVAEIASFIIKSGGLPDRSH